MTWVCIPYINSIDFPNIIISFVRTSRFFIKLRDFCNGNEFTKKDWIESSDRVCCFLQSEFNHMSLKLLQQKKTISKVDERNILKVFILVLTSLGKLWLKIYKWQLEKYFYRPFLTTQFNNLKSRWIWRCKGMMFVHCCVSYFNKLILLEAYSYDNKRNNIHFSYSCKRSLLLFEIGKFQSTILLNALYEKIKPLFICFFFM